MDFESILEGILLAETERSATGDCFLNGRDCLIVGATAESLKRALRLNQ